MKQFKQLREDALMEKLKASAPTAEWIHDFVHSENPKFAGKSKKERIRMALGAAYAAKRNEEVEPIDELNKDTVYSYAAKAEKDVNKKHKELTSQIKTNNPQSANNTASKIVKRYAGMDRAETRLNKEETEQIDELSKDTLNSFIKKSKETYKDVPDTKKGNRLRNTLKAASKSDAKNEEVELKESHEEAEEHLSKANDADAKGDKMGYHYHMADHHDALSQWHESKGRSAAADKHAEKADYHSDKYTEHANGMYEAMNPAQQAAIAIAIKKKKKKMMEAYESLNEKFWDNEGEMVISQCKTIAAKAQMIMSMLDDESKLEAWVQGKMTTAEIAINSVHDHLMYSDDAIDEATGDKSFDSMMKTIVTGTSKQRTADRIAQKKQNQERARNAFGGMFGGGNPADKLDIRKKGVAEDWSKKYKNSINCSHPKGFSQKAHCAGKKKQNENIDDVMETTCPDCGMCETHGNLNEIKKGQKDSNGYTKCWPGHHAEGTKKSAVTGKQVRNCVTNEDFDQIDEKEVWDTPNPKKTHHKLSPQQVSRAKARARAAGRPYPNLVDNMAVMKEETVEEAYKGAGSSALKLADRIRQERLKREASEKRAQEMLGKKSDEKKEVK
jgi:hypothetical protein